MMLMIFLFSIAKNILTTVTVKIAISEYLCIDYQAVDETPGFLWRPRMTSSGHQLPTELENVKMAVKM